MKTGNLLTMGLFVGISVLDSGSAIADNCTGNDSLVTVSASTLDLGKGMSLTVFQSESIVTSTNSHYDMTSGQCSGTTLVTPDGKQHTSGHCARRDKDGDLTSIEWSQGPGAEQGIWKTTGGTGKFAGKSDSGWYRNVLADGKRFNSKWGGNCM